jgi:hypothetical protein
MPRFVFGSRKKEEDLSKKDVELQAPIPPVQEVKKQEVKEEVPEPAKIQLVTESQLLNFKLDRILEILESSMVE